MAFKQCKKSPNGRHHWVHWKTRADERSGHAGGEIGGLHCQYCGRAKW